MKIKEIPASWRWRAPKAGHTLDKLGRAAGLHSGSISRLSNEKVIPNMETVARIEGVLTDWGVGLKIEVDEET